MLILIDGPDGSGKTTLVNNLISHGMIKVDRICRDIPNQYDVTKTIFENCAKDNAMYVIDRYYLTELVYRTILNDKKPTIKLDEIVKLLNIPNILYVFCDTDTAFNDAQLRGEDFIKDERIHNDLRNLYRYIYNILVNFTTVSVIKYNYTTDDVSVITNKIDNMRLFN